MGNGGKTWIELWIMIINEIKLDSSKCGSNGCLVETSRFVAKTKTSESLTVHLRCAVFHVCSMHNGVPQTIEARTYLPQAIPLCIGLFRHNLFRGQTNPKSRSSKTNILYLHIDQLILKSQEFLY
ncbi:unnamed protein product [Arabidopsis lyrata]|uniref:Predicted protein n=1 Tax=Arabidopsis lyrata subsp. lyrata TaxID=81972 RepID=D7M7Q3_ARALL|nr:predicted protein [Arabidopsis lyrata subsp. lyrata]CAH8272585.1 unnamed protein product [Arabidopsis lyrata]